MIYPIALLLGAFYGWRRAAKRGGNRMDQLQYAAVYAIIALLLALLAIALANLAGLI